MVYFNVLGQHFLVLGSLQRTTDLFENRSLNYSDRMRLPMLVELCVLDSFTSHPFKKNFCLFQNEVGFRLPFSAIRRNMEEIQAHISRVFPSQWGVQIPTYSKARGPHVFASTTWHTWQFPQPHSTVSVMHMHFSRILIKRYGNKLIWRYFYENFIWNWRSRVWWSLYLTDWRISKWNHWSLNSGSLLGRLFSYLEVCTKLVSRCRLSKESCILETS